MHDILGRGIAILLGGLMDPVMLVVLLDLQFLGLRIYGLLPSRGPFHMRLRNGHQSVACGRTRAQDSP